MAELCSVVIAPLLFLKNKSIKIISVLQVALRTSLPPVGCIVLELVYCVVSSFFKQEADKLKDDDLYKHLQDLKKPSPKLKQLKSIKGKFGRLLNLIFSVVRFVVKDKIP